MFHFQLILPGISCVLYANPIVIHRLFLELKKKKDDGDTFPQYIVSKIGLILNTKQKHTHDNNFKGNI